MHLFYGKSVKVVIVLVLFANFAKGCGRFSVKGLHRIRPSIININRLFASKRRILRANAKPLPPFLQGNDEENFNAEDKDFEREEDEWNLGDEEDIYEEKNVRLDPEIIQAIGGIDGEDWANAWAEEQNALSEYEKEQIDLIKRAAGKPEVIKLLQDNSAHLSVPLIAAAFPFPLDDYQLHSVRTLLQNASLVLSAPTGAGKTVAGEAAVYAALAKGKRVFYTTPLKALSNQKFLDLSKALGPEKVGLSTGDVRQNVDAQVVVMTTEVYRNMLYSRDRDGGREEGRLDSVDAVVLDEFHYMNDEDRGTVWEESVINSPTDVKLVALSATMANPDQVKAWIEKVHGPCNLVLSTNRPVPLRFGYCDRWGILPLFNGPKSIRGKGFFRQRPCEEELAQSILNRPGKKRMLSRKQISKLRSQEKLNPEILSREARKKRIFLRSVKGDESGALRRFKRAQTPPMGLVTRELRKSRLLPAIVFIFSRKGCEEAAKDVVAHVDALTNEAEKAEIGRRLLEFERKSPGIVNPERQWMVREGVATHHAGLLPVWKAFVEELFQDGLLKVVFATETLAAGINMPARTTVISALARRRGEGVAMLTSSELRQMAGRAGRRGKDTVGYSIVLKSRFRGPQDAHRLVRKDAEPLKSKFTPTYGMVLNLLSMLTIEEARNTVANSFGSFLRSIRMEKRAEKRAKQEKIAKEIVGDIDPEEFIKYNKMRFKLKEEMKALEYLTAQSLSQTREYVTEMLQWAPVGTPILIPGASNDHVSALLLDDGGRTLPPYLVALGKDNRFYIIPDTEVLAVDFDHPVDMLPQEAQTLLNGLRRPPWVSYNDDPPMYSERSEAPDTMEWIDAIPTVAAPEDAPEVIAQKSRVEKLEGEMKASPFHDTPRKKRIIKAFKFLRKLEEENAEKERQRQAQIELRGDVGGAELRSSFLWNQFLNLSQVLNKYGFLEGMTTTKDLGILGAGVKGDNELWISLALLELDNMFWDQGIQPQHLAAALAAIVSYEPPPGSADMPKWLQASDDAMDIIDYLGREVAGPLEVQQLNHRVTLPINLETYYAGLVEAWALGEDWMSLSEGSGMQEGDLCNLLRRTLDLLRLIPRLPTLSRAFKRQARSAIKMIGRYPITDMVTYEIQPEEVLSEEEKKILDQEENSTVDPAITEKVEVAESENNLNPGMTAAGNTNSTVEERSEMITIASSDDRPPPRASELSGTSSAIEGEDEDVDEDEKRLRSVALRSKQRKSWQSNDDYYDTLLDIVSSDSKQKETSNIMNDKKDKNIEDFMLYDTDDLDDDDEDDSLFDDDDEEDDMFSSKKDGDSLSKMLEDDFRGFSPSAEQNVSQNKKKKGSGDVVQDLLDLLGDNDPTDDKNDW
mmetsp:Transcript_16735/g.25180  ORF Transcript_16735/g.25180 Transcript_16735/m.25180 type:complete len:1367 (+) Transcript_16735:262-4362(+)